MIFMQMKLEKMKKQEMHPKRIELESGYSGLTTLNHPNGKRVKFDEKVETK